VPLIMRPATIILALLLILLQYKIWFAPGSVIDSWRLKESVAALTADNANKQQRNAILTADIKDLKQGDEAVEERARTELGMVKKGEVFYQIVE